MQENRWRKMCGSAISIHRFSLPVPAHTLCQIVLVFPSSTLDAGPSEPLVACSLPDVAVIPSVGISNSSFSAGSFGMFVTEYVSRISSPNYSNRQWAGLTNDYYKMRWEKWIAERKKELAGNSSWVPVTSSTFVIIPRNKSDIRSNFSAFPSLNALDIFNEKIWCRE